MGPTEYPVIVTILLVLLGTTVLTYCFSTARLIMLITAVRIHSVESWSRLTYTKWRIQDIERSNEVVLAVYVDSYLFITSQAILQIGVGLQSNDHSCEYVSLLCSQQSGYIHVHILLLLFKSSSLTLD
jgi:hypothetical protein